MTTKRGLRIGIDTGGTFTDVVGVRSDTGEVFTTKTPTTPADFSEGLIQGVRKILSETKIRPAMVNGVFHGTTVATNAILERRFEDLGFIVTGRVPPPAGNRRGEWCYEGQLRRLRCSQKPKDTLVPPERVREAKERISASGEVLESLNEQDALKLARWFKGQRIGSVGVCLLHAYANPAHEELILEAFEREYPECFVSISSEVIPEPGEYERAITTLLDACIKPRIKAYTSRKHRRKSRIRSAARPS